MRLHGISVFLFAFVFAAALLAQSVMAVKPGPITPENAHVSNPNEYVAAHYQNALNSPVKELETRFSELAAGRPILVYCAKDRPAERDDELVQEKRADIKAFFFIRGDPILQ